MGILDGFMDTFGGILIGGFGDDAAIGFLFGLMDDITPEDCYGFIKSNEPLFPDVSDDDWQKYGKLARQANIGEVDTDRIINEFRDRRPDLLSVVLNHPDGLNWLDRQVTILKQKLGI